MNDIRNARQDNINLLDKIIKKLIEERLFIEAYKKTRETAEYNEWVEETKLLNNDIMSIMGQNQKLFIRYEEILTLREDAFLKNAYKQGFLDGMKILKEINSTI